METGLISFLLLLVHLSMAVIGAGHALLFKRDPRAAITWMVVCLFVPFAGPTSYYIFGVNRVRTRARQYRAHRGVIGFERPERYSEVSLSDVSALGPLATVGATISGHFLLPGNDVKPLHYGDEAYDVMLSAIENAQEKVYLASYIFESDSTGQRFIDALVAAHERGVDVKIILDGVGQYYSYPTATRLMKRAGLDVSLFLPFRFFPPALHFNLRNHRKILVTDSNVAFTGGMNIGGRHVADSDDKPRMTDVHFQLTGPVAYELCNAFCDDWYFTTGKEIDPGKIQANAFGPATCRLILDDPGENLDRLAMVINGVVSAAKKRIDIMTPYFLPSRELIAALHSAKSRGVQVRIVLPESNNLAFVNWATTNMLWELLMWDIEVYYQPAPFCHSKLLLVDDDYVLMGSANLDPRSLRLNFELGVEIFDRGLASHVDTHFCDICGSARPVTLREVDSRNLLIRFRDSLAWLFSPYL